MTIGSIVIYPALPHWGHGIIVNVVNGRLHVLFDDDHADSFHEDELLEVKDKSHKARPLSSNIYRKPKA